MPKRTEIRNALVSLLTGATSANDRVYKNRPQNFSVNTFPVINITDGDESAVPRDTRSTQYIRTWTMKVEIRIEASTNFDDALDVLAEEIEAAINTDRQLSGKVTGISYIGTDEPIFDASGAKPIGFTSLTYQIKYIS